jgi:hypothetical protein
MTKPMSLRLSPEQLGVFLKVVVERKGTWERFGDACGTAARDRGYFGSADSIAAGAARYRVGNDNPVSGRAATVYLDVLENDPRLDFLEPVASSVKPGKKK